MDQLPLHLKLGILSLVNQSKEESGEKTAGVTDPEKLLPPVRFFKNERGENKLQENSLSFFSKESLANIEAPGYHIFDGFLGAEIGQQCYEQANDLYEKGVLSPSSMSKGEEKWRDENVRGDHIAWLSDKQKKDFQTSHPQLYFLYNKIEKLRMELNEATGFNCQKTSTQITCYPGKGTRYVRHLDAFLGGSDRRLTFLYYMNPDWDKSKGGNLKVFLEDHQVVEIEPKQDRLLVFQSRRLEHEVLPVHQKRFATTVWFY